jgi:hypothetical protein
MSKQIQPMHLILTALASMLITFVTLEYYGYIRHSSEQDVLNTGQYRSVLLDAGEQYKMSHKPSDKQPRCVQGFLALEFIHNGKPAGFLVDDKNRGITCHTSNKPESGTKTAP